MKLVQYMTKQHLLLFKHMYSVFIDQMMCFKWGKCRIWLFLGDKMGGYYIIRGGALFRGIAVDKSVVQWYFYLDHQSFIFFPLCQFCCYSSFNYRSDEWKDLSNEDKAKIGLTFQDDGEFWWAFLKTNQLHERKYLCHPPFSLFLFFNEIFFSLSGWRLMISWRICTCWI